MRTGTLIKILHTNMEDNFVDTGTCLHCKTRNLCLCFHENGKFSCEICRDCLIKEHPDFVEDFDQMLEQNRKSLDDMLLGS